MSYYSKISLSVLLAASFGLLSSCSSSSNTELYQDDSFEDDFVYQENSLKQEQEEGEYLDSQKRRDYKDYSNEDWFYDYYDVGSDG